MTFPFAQLRLTISLHVHTIIFNAYMQLNFCIYCSFFCVFFHSPSSEFWHEKVTNNGIFVAVLPQIQLFTLKIQCNMQIAWIRLTKIINIGNLFEQRRVVIALSIFAYCVNVHQKVVAFFSKGLLCILILTNCS